MRRVVPIEIPTVEEILKDTSENLDEISANIARINATMPLELEENPTNTNMLLLIKRYINGLKDTRLVIPPDDLLKIHKLVSISDNVTNSTFRRLTELLRVEWSVVMINQNHQLNVISDGRTILDQWTHVTIDCTLETMLLEMMRYVLDNYGSVDLRLNTEYIPSYSVNNIITAIRNNKNISSYIFEKFCKIWNIAYSYTMTSMFDKSVSKTITLDPSGWM